MKKIVSVILSVAMIFAFSIDAMASGGIRINRDVTEIKAHEYEGKKSFTYVDVSSYQNPYYAYYISGMGSVKDTDYWLHSNLESIGDYAFYDTGLHSFTIDIYVTHIGEYAIGWYKDTDGNPDQVRDFSICGAHGTYAEQYAKENNFRFVDNYNLWNDPYAAGNPSPVFVPGDYNDDDRVTIEDAQLCLKNYVDTVAGLPTIYGVNVSSDVNNDDILDVKDAQLILKYYTANSVADSYVSWYKIRN